MFKWFWTIFSLGAPETAKEGNTGGFIPHAIITPTQIYGLKYTANKLCNTTSPFTLSVYTETVKAKSEQVPQYLMPRPLIGNL